MCEPDKSLLQGSGWEPGSRHPWRPTSFSFVTYVCFIVLVRLEAAMPFEVRALPSGYSTRRRRQKPYDSGCFAQAGSRHADDDGILDSAEAMHAGMGLAVKLRLGWEKAGATSSS